MITSCASFDPTRVIAPPEKVVVGLPYTVLPYLLYVPDVFAYVGDNVTAETLDSLSAPNTMNLL